MLSSVHRFHGLGSLRPVYKTAQVVRGHDILIRYQLNPRLKTYRSAVVVSKKVSKLAVTRNRIRRRIYEAIRQNEAKIIQPFEFVIIVFSDSFADEKSSKVCSAVEGLLTKSGVIL